MSIPYYPNDPSLSRPSTGEYGPKIGLAEGVCPRCGRIRRKPYPEKDVLCDCWEFCPINHGSGPYSVRMNDYQPSINPDVGQSPGGNTEKRWNPMGYQKIEHGIPGGEFYGEIEHPYDILKVCPICKFHSTQKPILVQLE